MPKYPRIQRVDKHPRNTSAKCIVCGEVADAKAHVEHNWFRGEDDVVWTHSMHKTIEVLHALEAPKK